MNPVLIVSALRSDGLGVLCRPKLVTSDPGEAIKELRRVRELGYRAIVDPVVPVPKKGKR
jgi:hypothetical protein